MRERRINYIIIILILVTFVVLLVPIVYFGFFAAEDTNTGAAETGEVAYSHKILQNTGTGFEVAWITDNPVQNPSVVYTTCSGDTTGIDSSTLSSSAQNVKESAGAGQPSNLHIFKLQNLSPGTKYCFQIRNLSENESGVSTLNSIVYDVTTLQSSTTELTTPNPLNGTLPSGLEESIVTAVLIERESGDIISNEIGSISDPNQGTWNLELTSFRDLDGNVISQSMLENSLYYISAFTLDPAQNFLNSELSQIIDTDIDTTELVALDAGSKDTTSDADRFASRGSVGNNDDDGGGGESETITPASNLESTEEVPNVSIEYGPEVVNIDPAGNTFTIIWETNIPTKSYVEYTINGQNKSNAFDPRSGRALIRELTTHYVEIIDTANQQASYQITLINNGIRTTTIEHERTGVASSPSSPRPATNVRFNQNGNYLDQILIAEFPDESTKVATVPNIKGLAQLDTTRIADVDDNSKVFDPNSASGEFKFSIIGGNITTSIDSEFSSLPSVIELESTPDDQTPVTVTYVNVADGEIIGNINPILGGEGVEEIEIIIEEQ